MHFTYLQNISDCIFNHMYCSFVVVGGTNNLDLTLYWIHSRDFCIRLEALIIHLHVYHLLPICEILINMLFIV